MSSPFVVVGPSVVRRHGANDSRFLAELHCELSRKGDRGGEAFLVNVVSRQQLEFDMLEDEVELGPGYLIARDFDESRIRGRLTNG